MTSNHSSDGIFAAAIEAAPRMAFDEWAPLVTAELDRCYAERRAVLDAVKRMSGAEAIAWADRERGWKMFGRRHVTKAEILKRLAREADGSGNPYYCEIVLRRWHADLCGQPR